MMPAYNAGQRLEVTVRELPEAVDECVLVYDDSTDAAVEAARSLRLTVEDHEANRGYGGNRKTRCARAIAAPVARR